MLLSKVVERDLNCRSIYGNIFHLLMISNIYLVLSILQRKGRHPKNNFLPDLFIDVTIHTIFSLLSQKQ